MEKVEEFRKLFLKLHRITALIESVWEYATCNNLLDDLQLEKLYNLSYVLYECEKTILQELGISQAILKDWSIRKYENKVLKWAREEENSPEMAKIASYIWSFEEDLREADNDKGKIEQAL